MTANSLLCRNALPSLTDYVLAPAWRDPRIGIVHLGIGNFHRAHEAVYTEEAMLAAGGDWGICGVTLQGDVSKRDALMAQDGLYSVVERGPEGVRVTVIRALKEVLAMPHDRARLFELLADENVRIVSLTVTEKGYCRDTKTGDVDLNHAGDRCTIWRIRTKRRPCPASSPPRSGNDATSARHPSPCCHATTSRITAPR